MKTSPSFKIVEHVITGNVSDKGDAEVIRKVHKSGLTKKKAQQLAEQLNAGQDSDEFPMRSYVAEPA